MRPAAYTEAGRKSQRISGRLFDMSDNPAGCMFDESCGRCYSQNGRAADRKTGPEGDRDPGTSGGDFPCGISGTGAMPGKRAPGKSRLLPYSRQGQRMPGHGSPTQPPGVRDRRRCSEGVGYVYRL